MNFNKLFPIVSVLGIFLLLSIVLFPDAFQGKVVQQPDMMSFRGIGSDVQKMKKETGEISVWTNSSFSGMPTYIWGGAPYTGNKLSYVQNWLVRLGLPFPSGLFFSALLTFFILALVLRINPWIGLIGAIAFALSTYNFLISEAGHMSKFLAIIYFPLIAGGTILAYRGKYLLGAVIFGLGMGLDLMAGHIQMTYYLGICLGVYVLVKLVYAVKEGTIKQFGMASAILLIPLMLAIGSNASRLWTSYEYMKETIRGPQILTASSGDSASGLTKDYVFDWSHGVAESISFLVPGAFGGGSSEPMDKDFATYKDLRKKGVGANGLKSAPLYWGDMPSTSGPIYFGAIAWFLFMIGLLLVKGPAKWWLLISTVLITMLSWGSNFMGFNELFYDYFPMYDKFRSVNSILAVLQLTVPLMGIIALVELTSKKIDRQDALKKLYMAMGIVGGFALIIGVAGSGFFDFAGANDARLQEVGYDLSALVADRKMMMRSDAFRSLLFVLLSGGLIWLYLKEKLNKSWGTTMMLGLMALLMLIDLGGVGKRYLNSENFVNARTYQNNFSLRPADEQILQDTDPNYRVFDLSINTFNSNRASNFHKTIGGYHAAKLRRYQDMIEKHIGVGNQQVLDMLNTKYFITKEGQAQRNPGAMGNAWFVQGVKLVYSNNEEIEALSQFDPKSTAVVHSEFKNEIGDFSSGSGEGSIQLESIQPNHLTYKSNTSSEELAVFSEVIYKPNEKGGWQSFIDGKPVDHFRANYILRAMKIPAGQHTIEFKFMPPAYYTGEVIALICSLLMIIGAIGYGVWEWKKTRN